MYGGGYSSLFSYYLPMYGETYIYCIAIFTILVNGIFCGLVGKSKGYSNGFWIGLFFGIFGLIYYAGLPDLKLREYIDTLNNAAIPSQKMASIPLVSTKSESSAKPRWNDNTIEVLILNYLENHSFNIGETVIYIQKKDSSHSLYSPSSEFMTYLSNVLRDGLIMKGGIYKLKKIKFDGADANVPLEKCNG